MAGLRGDSVRLGNTRGIAAEYSRNPMEGPSGRK